MSKSSDSVTENLAPQPDPIHAPTVLTGSSGQSGALSKALNHRAENLEQSEAG